MLTYKKGNYRNIESSFRSRLSNRKLEGLATSGNIDDELWIILDYYSEVESVGMDLLKKAGIHNLIRKRIFKHFQAYIRQAKTYYISAKTLPARSSGLLYYYCFLNLAKAAIVLKDPSIAGKFIRHGLTYNISNNSDMSGQLISVQDDGVFKKLYELYFGTPLNIKRFNIQTLFNYCSDLNYQCDKAKISEKKIARAYFAGGMSKIRKTSWGIVGFSDLKEVAKYTKTMKPFFDLYELIDIPQLVCRDIFKLSAYQRNEISFFQSIVERPWLGPDIPNFNADVAQLMTALGKVFQVNYFKEDFDFKIALPYKRNRQERTDELIAIYVIMFYISELVRYKPAYLENLLNRKESWLIESFVKSCPITFLRMMISHVIGVDYVLEIR